MVVPSASRGRPVDPPVSTVGPAMLGHDLEGYRVLHKQSKCHHGGDGSLETRMNARSLAWERRTRRVLASRRRRRSCVSRSRLLAV